MQVVIRTNSENEDFRKLVGLLDADLAIRNGDSNDFFAQFNKIDTIKNTVVAYRDNIPLGIGAFKPFDEDSVEIKRMYVIPEHRRTGIAKAVLNELENWAKELGYNACVLETGITNPEALDLYQKAGYRIIPNFGQYAGVENSVCMKKEV